MTKAKHEYYTCPNQFLKVPSVLIRSIFSYLPTKQAEVAQKEEKKEEKEVITRHSVLQTSQLFKVLSKEEYLTQELVEYYATGNQVKIERLFTKYPEFRNKPISDRYFSAKLAQCSKVANQEQMQRLLAMRPHLAAQRTLFTDWSGRTFNCSPFEYALWALDVKYMCPMILDCLPENEAGEAIRVQLLKQAQSIQTRGLSYELKGTLHHEQRFSLEPLKSALQTYIDNFSAWDWPQRDQHWCTVVGQAQLLLPAYIRQHYCDPDESFFDSPTFTKKQFTRAFTFTNWARKGTEQIWDGSLSGLGVDFAMGGAGGGWRGAGGGSGRAGAGIDFATITALDKMRTETDFPLLMQRLESPLQKLEDTHGPRYMPT